MQTTPIRNQSNHGTGVPEFSRGDAHVGGMDIPPRRCPRVAHNGRRDVGSCVGGRYSDWNGLGVRWREVRIRRAPTAEIVVLKRVDEARPERRSWQCSFLSSYNSPQTRVVYRDPLVTSLQTWSWKPVGLTSYLESIHSWRLPQPSARWTISTPSGRPPQIYSQMFSVHPSPNSLQPPPLQGEDRSSF